MRAFFGRREVFVCHSALCRLVSGSLSNTDDSSSVITLSQKSDSISSFAPANTDKFPTGSLFAPQISFSAPVLHKFFACANGLLEFYELHFYPSPFLLQSSWHSIGGLSPSQLAPFPHFDHLLTRLVFQNEGRLQHFLGRLWKLCAT